ncbi:MFS domain-containing protein [Aphelenchoides besseyi]|nr:MFS domain-containing protein [Aphelenchoides besseyi]
MSSNLKMIDEKRSSLIKSDPNKQDGTKHPSLFNPLSRRFHVLLLIMIGYFAMVYMRTNLGLAMTCMINTTAQVLKAKETAQLVATPQTLPHLSTIDLTTENNETAVLGCSRDASAEAPIINDYGGSLEWDSQIQGLLFSASFYGSLVSLVPCGVLVDRYSPRMLLQISAIISILCTISLPYLANSWGYQAVFVCRFILGIGEGLILPSINKLVSMWIPTHELSTAASIYTNGNQMAGFVGFPLSALLCDTIIGIVWLLIWSLTITDTPQSCRWMSKKERAYLNEQLQHNQSGNNDKAKREPIPYRAMLTSFPLWSLLLCTFTANIIVVLNQVYLPLFFKEVLVLGMFGNGIFSAAPNVSQLIVKMAWSMTMDRLKQKRLSKTAACKISQSFSSVSVGGLFVILAYVARCDRPFLSLLILCLITMCFSIAISGFYTSLLSLAPRYTGTLTSIAMMSGYLGRLVTPRIVPFFNKSGTMAEWRMVFYFMSATTLLSGLFFLLFGSGNPQKWGRTEPEPPKIFIDEAEEKSMEMLEEKEALRQLRRESHVESVVLDLLD